MSPTMSLTNETHHEPNQPDSSKPPYLNQLTTKPPLMTKPIITTTTTTMKITKTKNKKKTKK